jgi:hypothetical protein
MNIAAPVRSALFVDFDNVYIGLKKLDSAAAERFAKNPQRWLAWLQTYMVEGGAATRRFLSRSCYLNPATFGSFRANYTSAGFRVVDCPALTKQGKNSADISIVIDALDLLAHAVRYDEFIIMSADADFTPLLVRLRAHDRRTVAIASGFASGSYRAVCDAFIDASDLLEALSDQEVKVGPQFAAPMSESPDAATLGAPAAPVVVATEPTPSAQAPGGSVTVPLRTAAVDVEGLGVAAAEAVRSALSGSVVPLPGATAALAAQRGVPALLGTSWAGMRNFFDFLLKYAPDLSVVRDNRGGWVLDPTRHTQADIPPALEETSIQAQVSRVADIPGLSSGQYRSLFTELAKDLVDNAPSVRNTPPRVRDSAAASGAPITRAAVTTVMQGLAGTQGLHIGATAAELETSWHSYVIEVCEAAGMALGDEDRTAVRNWFKGDAP